MHNHSIDQAELITLLEKKEGILITANTRLMPYFQELYGKWQCNNNKTVFEQPSIYSYDMWLKKSWQKFRSQFSSPVSLLQSHQAHFLWEAVIDKNNAFYFNMDGIIEDVKKAWKLCWTWNIDVNNSALFSDNVDTHAFYQWASHYKKILNKGGWIDEAMLPVILKNIFVSVNFPAKGTCIVVLAGFDRCSPSLLECLHAFSGQEPVVYESIRKAKKINKLSFLSEEEELDAFLLWAKKGEYYSPLQEPEQQNNRTVGGNTIRPNAINIACVMPNLSEKRNKIERFIQRYFQEKEYNISAGYIFSNLSMIASALNMLRIKQALHAKQDVTLKDFYFLLESRYLGEAEETQRSIILKDIHRTENAGFSWNSLLKFLRKAHLNLAGRLEKFEQFVLPRKASPSEWKEIFQALLIVLNWPGPYGLDSYEYQTYERWMSLLKEYHQLDLITAKAISFSKALSMLKKMATRTIFQPSKKEAHIHFLGFLEVAGLAFDSVWVMGMSAEEFPGKVQFNPFIPHKMQRHYQLPHATHEIEYAFASQLIQHFMSSGNNVVFSYLCQKDGIQRAESSLIKNIDDLDQSFHEKMTKKEPPFLLETIIEQEEIPFVLGETIQGGTSLIKNQALCPFRAFAKHRLKTSGFEKLTVGLVEHERGSMVHKVLENFWFTVKTHQQLISYTTAELEKLVHAIANQTVEDFIASEPYKVEKLPVVFRKLEVKRLERLLIKWLEIEQQRPPFHVVSIEEAKTIELVGLTLKIRVDRVDQLENGEKIVIDYKTGTLPSLASTDDRPENPQLLLYALSDLDIKAWAFAQVKAATPLFKGVSAQKTAIKGIVPIDWETERTQWEKMLNALAEEFIQGKNQPLPKKNACNTCDLHGLCRIRELNLVEYSA